MFENQGLSAEQARYCALVAAGHSQDEARKLVGVTEYRTAKWHADVPAFESALRRARAIVLERRVDRMADVARTEPDVQRARLIIDTDKWLASKLIQHVYGDRLDVAVDHRVSVVDALAAARARATLRPICDLPAPIDAAFEAQPSVTAPGAVDKESADRVVSRLPDIFD